MKRLSFAALALAAAALTAGTASAQQTGMPEPGTPSGTRGLTFGLDLGGGAVGFDRTASEMRPGANVGLIVGYGVSDAVTLFLRTDVGYRMGHVDLGARYSFGASHAALRPYVEGALTRTGATDGDVRSHGFGFTGGAGVEYFVSRNVSLDVGVAHSRGRFTSDRVDGRGFGSTRVHVGFRLRP